MIYYGGQQSFDAFPFLPCLICRLIFFIEDRMTQLSHRLPKFGGSLAYLERLDYAYDRDSSCWYCLDRRRRRIGATWADAI